jgi:hypothetical protein
MNPSGLGLTGRPVTEEPKAPAAPAATGLRGVLATNRTLVLLAVAGVVLATGGAAALLLTAGSTPPAGGSAPAPATTTAASSSPGTGTTTSASPTPSTDPAGTRNPFAPRPSATVTGSAGGSGSATGSTGTSTSAVTTTVTDPAVYLALFSIASDGKASFSLNGTTFAQRPGDSFGDGDALTYHKSVKVAGVTCASVGYLDQTVTVCPGEMHHLG